GRNALGVLEANAPAPSAPRKCLRLIGLDCSLPFIVASRHSVECFRTRPSGSSRWASSAPSLTRSLLTKCRPALHSPPRSRGTTQATLRPGGSRRHACPSWWSPRGLAMEVGIEDADLGDPIDWQLVAL